MINNLPLSPAPSKNFKRMQEFRERDERGKSQPANQKPSYTGDQASDHIAASGPDPWTDKNGNGKTELTYTFFKRPTINFDDAGLTGFSAFNREQKNDALKAMQNYGDVAGITFTKDSPKGSANGGEGHVGFGNFGGTANPKAGMRGVTLVSAEREGWDSFYRNKPMPGTATFPAPDAPGRFLKLHELGHQLGQGHPGFYNNNHRLGFEKAKTYQQDTNAYTVMSYWPETHSGHDFTKDGVRHYPKGLMMDDITSIQKRYGANHETRSGDTVYGFNSNSERDHYSVKSNDDPLVASIWDGGGHDTLDLSGYRDDQKINLNAGTFSDVGGMKGNLSIAPNVVIEDALGGSGDDLIQGNQAPNNLVGGAGDDVIDGGPGQDRLWGGRGKDTFVFSDASHSTAAAPDKIMDFRRGQDTIDVSNIRAATGKSGLSYVDEFSGQAGEARLHYNPKKRLSSLEIDLDGKGMAGFKVNVSGKVLKQDIVA
ncbi:M10 family metallopeptidase C-terminal domain-containing protein [Pseudomonas cyclaminis]|uniref:M10 family metallopeptidase C-terminal domain-containing protein n=1 Tax=Pseudomonas cyclaminis TaxID=2781239 RepID=UPI001880F0AA|nr:M10 family metallopeptidase C-terminal domain-containing protein [Pseudomonas cyclaminis]MBE8601832.1 M10 family metallopeptidase C-terminal domain-containing protein [Pseudomonas cyclaminis]